MHQVTLTPLAWTREAERCEKLARLAQAEYERVEARRMRKVAQWAREMAGRDVR